ncbi:MAG: LytTR family DNA-binding domain-containing protein [Thermoanaerobaculia bacterium]
MGLASPWRRRIRWSSWIVVVGFWITATVLSALQIYLREAARGLKAPWSDVLAANALAWLPWLAIAPAALWLERRFPVPGSRTGVHLLVHIGAAVLISLAFLFYLAFFHATYLEGGGLFPSWETLESEYTEKLGQHFLVAVMLYSAIVLGSFGYRTWSTSSAKREDGESTATSAEALEAAGAAEAHAALIARSVGEVERIDPREVDWIEACGNYARLHVGDHKVLIRRTLASISEELAATGFVRVHRSAIVNAGRVAKLRTGSHGDATIELESGQRIKVSRTYRRAVEKQLL